MSNFHISCLESRALNQSIPLSQSSYLSIISPNISRGSSPESLCMRHQEKIDRQAKRTYLCIAVLNRFSSSRPWDVHKSRHPFSFTRQTSVANVPTYLDSHSRRSTEASPSPTESGCSLGTNIGASSVRAKQSDSRTREESILST